MKPLFTIRVWFFLSWVVWSLACPHPALAIQTHGQPEGFYTHQMAHLAFLAGIIYILFRTKNRQGNGWRLVRFSFILFALWNINTFIVHTMQTSLSPMQFQGNIGELPQYFIPRSGLDIYFFFGKMDHLLFFPGILCLALGLKKLGQN